MVGVTVNTGVAFTLTVATTLDEQMPVVPVIVYTVVELGEKFNEDPP